MEAMIPHSDLCTTQCCLANPTKVGAKYLVYIPNDDHVNVDLSGSPIKMSTEWFNPRDGTIINAPAVFGCSIQTFSAPFSGEVRIGKYLCRWSLCFCIYPMFPGA